MGKISATEADSACWSANIFKKKKKKNVEKNGGGGGEYNSDIHFTEVFV